VDNPSPTDRRNADIHRVHRPLPASALLAVLLACACAPATDPEAARQAAEQRRVEEARRERARWDSALERALQAWPDSLGAPVLQAFYRERGGEPLWADSARRAAWTAALPVLEGWGLPAERATPPAWVDPPEAGVELAWSAAVLRAARALAHGRHTGDSAALAWRPTDRVPDWAAPLAEGFSPERWAALGPAQPPYRALAGASVAFHRTFPDEDWRARVPTFREDSVLARTLACELLLHRGWLDSAGTARGGAIDSALRRFQRMHGLTEDGLVGTFTAEALGRSNRERRAQLALTLERWRLEPEWPQPFAWVALPHFTLWIVDADTTLFAHRVVVGTPDNATPELSSAVDVVVAYPYWHVPYSIASTEILPKARGDSAYLVRNRYALRDRDGNAVDPASVDWSGVSAGNFPYLVRQEGGTGNALGLVKFLFPNPYAVYLHDTNAKRYFDKERRAYSHGCVRLDRPMDFAAYLFGLQEDGPGMAEVRAAIDERRERKMPLRRKLPVHFRHFSAVAGADGLPVFGPDLYGLDEATRAAWRHRPADTAGLPAEAAAPAVSP
jgi:murein L,D-transpeptidase YcbB/YkuD